MVPRCLWGDDTRQDGDRSKGRSREKDGQEREPGWGQKGSRTDKKGLGVGQDGQYGSRVGAEGGEGWARVGQEDNDGQEGETHL